MKSLTMLLIGAAIGAAAVALFTTDQGTELRLRIKNYLTRKGLLAENDVDELVEMIATEIEAKQNAPENK